VAGVPPPQTAASKAFFFIIFLSRRERYLPKKDTGPERKEAMAKLRRDSRERGKRRELNISVHFSDLIRILYC
jgi:hypothetical protein